MFNSFERKDHKFNTKERLKVETSKIVDDLCQARKEGKKTKYDASPGNYRTPEIELTNRSFTEAARYYPPFDRIKANGIKVVPKPAGTVKDLLEE